MVVGKEPVAWTGRRAVVAFPEHVDMSNAAQIREQLLEVFDRGAAVVIADMSATVWCDYVGVDAVARACQRAAICRADLRLVATAPAVRRLLAAEGLDRLVPVYSSVEATSPLGTRTGRFPAAMSRQRSRPRDGRPGRRTGRRTNRGRRR